MQKPDPKKFATIGKLKEIIAKNNKDKNDIEQRRKAYGTDLSEMSPEDAKEQIRLNQIEDQNKRYGDLIVKANKEAAAKAKNMVPVGRLNQIADSLLNSGASKVKVRAGLGGGMESKYAKGIMKSADSDLTRGLRYKALANIASNKAKNK
jgi:ribosomal protein L11 methylase PrmA